ncbi:MAG: T9SS type A sorting domain-containing protein, partial [Calditrichales bacterium]|nr:T9SS type A sorting domain-containing protein [Calditrichales bacterium]
KLHNNFPNPFNPGTTLRFEAPKNGGSLELVIYDVLGKKIKTLYSGVGGQITREWNGKNESGNSMPSGIYFAVLKTKDFSQSVKMLLVK